MSLSSLWLKWVHITLLMFQAQTPLNRGPSKAFLLCAGGNRHTYLDPPTSSKPWLFTFEVLLGAITTYTYLTSSTGSSAQYQCIPDKNHCLEMSRESTFPHFSNTSHVYLHSFEETRPCLNENNGLVIISYDTESRSPSLALTWTAIHTGVFIPLKSSLQPILQPTMSRYKEMTAVFLAWVIRIMRNIEQCKSGHLLLLIIQ